MSGRKVAVITGGSSGIGRSIVKKLHAEGWLVYTCGRDPVKLARLQQEYPAVRTAVCDVSDRLAVRSFAAQIAAESGAVHLLVSNAGHLHEIDFTNPLEDVDLTADFRVNVIGAVNVIAEFLPALLASRQAAICIVSSGYALAPATRAPLYSASKAALHSFSKALRQQLAPKGVHVSELLPPVVDTPSVAHRQGPKLSPDQVATLAVAGALNGQDEVRPGLVRFLPLLLRLAPAVAERIVAKS